MIRVGRACLFWKNSCNFPLFIQRSACLPKQFFVEFSVVSDKVSELKEIEKPPKKETKPVNNFPHLKKEMDFGILKETFRETLIDSLRNSQETQNNFYKDWPVCFSPKEIIQILKLIAEKKIRPRDYLKELCTVILSKKSYAYTTWECSDVLYALAKLSFRDVDVIEVFVERLKKVKNFESPKIASSLILSLSKLQYRDVELLKQLLHYISQCDRGVKHTLTCLTGVALLNYCSPEVEKLIKFLLEFDEVNFTQSTSYLDFVWTCVLLNKEDLIIHHLPKILSEKFASKFLDHGGNTSLKWKLLNVNGAAQLLPSYDGPLLNNNPIFRALSLSLPKQTNPFLDAVKDTLTYIFPKTGNLKMLVQTGSGFYLDFEYVEEADSEAKAIRNKSRKIGIMLINFKDVCSDGTLSGLPAFKLRILKGLGYKVACIRYDEFPFCDPLSEKISILKQKIENLERKEAIRKPKPVRKKKQSTMEENS